MTDDTITIYRPGNYFPAVSVTGHRCDLMCDHCRGANLRGMATAETPDELIRKATDVKKRGGTGLLISGGCDQSGRVPLTSFEGTVKKIAGMGLELNIHAGLVDRKEAERLVNSGVSVFSVDIHQDPTVIRNALHLDRDPDAYGEAIDNIVAAGGKAVPHVTVGFGRTDLILSAEFLKKRGFKEVTLLVLVPTGGTEIVVPVSKEAVIEAISILHGMGFDVTLGCMRSRDHELEKECIKAGIRKMANPSLRTVRWAEENGFNIVEIKKCCSL